MGAGMGNTGMNRNKKPRDLFRDHILSLVGLEICLVSFSHALAPLHLPYSLPILTALFFTPVLPIFSQLLLPHNSSNTPSASTLPLLFPCYFLVHTSQGQSI